MSNRISPQHAGLGELPVEDLVVVHLADGVVDDGDQEVDEDEHGAHLEDEQEEGRDVVAAIRNGKIQRFCETNQIMLSSPQQV